MTAADLDALIAAATTRYRVLFVDGTVPRRDAPVVWEGREAAHATALIRANLGHRCEAVADPDPDLLDIAADACEEAGDARADDLRLRAIVFRHRGMEGEIRNDWPYGSAYLSAIGLIVLPLLGPRLALDLTGARGHQGHPGWWKIRPNGEPIEPVSGPIACAPAVLEALRAALAAR